MKKFLNIKLALPIMATMIAILASAFTVHSAGASNVTTTSYYANEVPDAGLTPPSNLTTSNYTNVTTTVATTFSGNYNSGTSSFVGTDCVTDPNQICAVKAQIVRNGGSFVSQTILIQSDGDFNTP